MADVDTEYDCQHCGAPLYFDTTSLHFKHKALFPLCNAPLAQAVSVVVGILMPDMAPYMYEHTEATRQP